MTQIQNCNPHSRGLLLALVFLMMLFGSSSAFANGGGGKKNETGGDSSNIMGQEQRQSSESSSGVVASGNSTAKGGDADANSFSLSKGGKGLGLGVGEVAVSADDLSTYVVEGDVYPVSQAFAVKSDNPCLFAGAGAQLEKYGFSLGGGRDRACAADYAVRLRLELMDKLSELSAFRLEIANQKALFLTQTKKGATAASAAVYPAQIREMEITAAALAKQFEIALGNVNYIDAEIKRGDHRVRHWVVDGLSAIPVVSWFVPR